MELQNAQWLLWQINIVIKNAFFPRPFSELLWVSRPHIVWNNFG